MLAAAIHLKPYGFIYLPAFLACLDADYAADAAPPLATNGSASGGGANGSAGVAALEERQQRRTDLLTRLLAAAASAEEACSDRSCEHVRCVAGSVACFS